jgi:hypothetical protein
VTTQTMKSTSSGKRPVTRKPYWKREAESKPRDPKPPKPVVEAETKRASITVVDRAHGEERKSNTPVLLAQTPEEASGLFISGLPVHGDMLYRDRAPAEIVAAEKWAKRVVDKALGQ